MLPTSPSGSLKMCVVGVLPSGPEVVRQGFSAGSCTSASGSRRTSARAHKPIDLPSVIEGRCGSYALPCGIGYRSPLIYETEYVERNAMRAPGRLPTAGQRHGRRQATRRPAVDNWHHRVQRRQCTDPKSSCVTATETGYPGSSRCLSSGEPRFLKALR
jgi:hypothetical protein